MIHSLNGCILPTPLSPMPTTLTNIPNNNSTNSQTTSYYLMANSSEWTNAGNISAGQNYQILIAPTAPVGAQAGLPNNYAQNGIANMCYGFRSPQEVWNNSLSSLVGNCSTLISSQQTGVQECSGKLGNTWYPASYPNSEIYVVLTNCVNGNSLAGCTSPLSAQYIIPNLCPNNNGQLFPPASNGGPSNCIAPLAGPYCVQVNSSNNPSGCGSYTPVCSNAASGGQVNQEFMWGSCRFANGMGISFGTNNLADNILIASTQANSGNGFDNSLDSSTIYFQSSTVLQQPSNVSLNNPVTFSFLGSNTMGYSSSNLPGTSGFNIGSQFINSNCMHGGGDNLSSGYALGVTSSNTATGPTCMGTGTFNYMAAHVTQSGCHAINGVPFNPYDADASQSNGRVEYIFSETQPASNQFGTPITEIMSGSSFLGIQNTANNSNNLYLRIRDTGNYADNIGYYQVQVTVQQTDTNNWLGNLIQNIVVPIQSQIFMVSQQMFTNVVNSNGVFQSIIQAMLTLYIIILGIGFVIGSTRITQKELVKKAVKIGVVLAFMNSSTATAFFDSYLLGMFWNGMTDLVSYVTGTSYMVVTNNGPVQHILNYNELFQFAANAVSFFFSMNFLTTIIVMLFWVPVGWILTILIIKGLIVYLNALVQAIVGYLIALTAVGLFIGLAPIFIVLVLFDQTRETFMNWLRVMVAFVLQPVVMFAAIALVNLLMTGALYEIENLTLNWECLNEVYIPIGSIKIDLFCLYWYSPATTFATLLVDVIMFNIFCEMLKQMPEFAGQIAAFIADASGVGKSAGQIAGAAHNIVDDAKKPLYLDEKSQQKIGTEQKSGDGGGGKDEGKQRGGVQVKGK
jgi:type IV secretory pathway VirB6-like protein